MNSSFVEPANSQNVKAIDAVPRHRLVTDREFFQLLNLNFPAFNQVTQNLVSGDTTQAFKILAEYLKLRVSPRYFFLPAEVPERIKNFAATYPEEIEWMKNSVGEFIQTYGSDVDWNSGGKDLLGRSHTANTVRFLARQALAVKTALLFHQSGNEFYLNNFLGLVKDFLTDYEAGVTESGANDVFERYYAGHRTRNWLFAHQLLLASPDYKWQNQILMLKAFLLHGARLYDVCKKFHWGNHQLHGLEGLFEITLMFPEFPVMQAWHKVAVQRILEHFEKEIKLDGFQFERASHYFKLDIMNYFRVFKLCRLNDIKLPPVFYEKFRKMFDAMVALAKPDKRLPVLHDAQATYAPQQVEKGVVSSNNVAELSDLREALFMSLGAVLFEEPGFKFFGDEKLPPALYWFLDAEAGRRYAKLPVSRPKVGSIALKDSRYYVMRSGWSEDDLYMIIDGGLAKYKPDHTHGQVLGIIAFAFGENILPNYRVRYSDPSYRTLKNSLVKNVALADNILQGQGWIDNKARTGFGIWKELPQPEVHEWLSGGQIDYFSGSHNGFETAGVYYTRKIFFLKPFYWVVIDAFQSDRPHSFQQIWQGVFEIDHSQNLAVSKQKNVQLLVRQADPSIIAIENKAFYGRKSVHFEKLGVNSYRFTTLVFPSKQDISTAVIKRFDRPEFQQVVVTQDSRKDMIFLKGDRNLKLAEIKSDADFVVLRYESNSLFCVVLHNGTSLQVENLLIQTDAPASVELVLRPSGEWESRFLKSPDEKINISINK